ncbi:GNAT family N-acetyltransferase [Micromonospora marina]|uniref:GNAT family N-acetyltransferase n=1 Tax=Micromonospora marina TaxID=307120 RepID=UPI003D71E1E3
MTTAHPEGSRAQSIVPTGPAHPAFDQVAALFDDYRAHYGQPSTPEITRSWLHDQIAQHRISAAAAIRADHVCGFITFTIMPASLMLGTSWSVRDLYVAPHHRRSGIAKALLQHVIRNARAAGAHRVSLQTETDNIPALALYNEIGFQPVTGLELLNLTFDPTLQDPGGMAGHGKQLAADEDGHRLEWAVKSPAYSSDSTLAPIRASSWICSQLSRQPIAL